MRTGALVVDIELGVADGAFAGGSVERVGHVALLGPAVDGIVPHRTRNVHHHLHVADGALGRVGRHERTYNWRSA
jgi:hypothetical protein